MTTREITYAPNELVHPTIINGRQQWVSPEVEELVRKMHYGDPTIGWQGDPRLALYYSREEQVWVVERLEADGQYRTVCRSRPGLALDNSLFMHLMAHDMRNGFSAEDAAEGSEKPMDEDKRLEVQEMLERVYYGAAKDLGYV